MTNADLIAQLKDYTQMIPRKKGVFLVGGIVRDIILGRIATDYDLIVLDRPRSYAKLLAESIDGKMIELGKPDNPLFRVVHRDMIFDVSPLNGNLLESDLQNRDFTVNAMAFDMERENIIDPCNGLEDLEKKMLRVVNKQAFKNDPIRLLRAFRICGTLNFSIHPKTTDEILKAGHLITFSAGERIRSELMKLLGLPNAYDFVEQMVCTRLLFHLFPELNQLAVLPPSDLFDQNPFNHSLKGFLSLESLLSRSEKLFPPLVHGEINPISTPLLKLAMLLHEIPAMAEPAPGPSRLYPDVKLKKPPDSIQSISKRIKLSGKECDFLSFIIEHHHDPVRLYLNQYETGFHSKRVKYFMKWQSYTPLIVIFSIAVMHGRRYFSKDKFYRFAHQALCSYCDDFLPKSLEKPLITGDDLIADLNMDPSPAFKGVLEIIEENRLSGTIHSRKEALAMARSLMETGRFNKDFDDQADLI
jgi:tRNA nucleotidyltransferase/poly(A) polymerase